MYNINQRNQHQYHNNSSYCNNFLDNSIVHNHINILNEDTKNMHILPPYCPMTLKTYKEFFKNNSRQNEIHNKMELFNDIKLYNETKQKKIFASPMSSNGSNIIKDIYNDCLNKPTFEYKRYSHGGYLDHAIRWVDNPIYTGDISDETIKLNEIYINKISENSMNLYSSVFEDMYILGYNPSNDKNTQYSDIDKVINNRGLDYLRRS